MKKGRLLTLMIPLGLVMVLAIACGDDEPAPSGVTASELQSAMTAAIEAAASSAPTGVTAEQMTAAVNAAVSAAVVGMEPTEGVSAAEISKLVEEAVKGQVKPGASAAEIASLVESAVQAAEAAREPGVTIDQLTKAVDDAVAAVKPVVVARTVVVERTVERTVVVAVDPRMGGTIKAIPQASFASMDPQWTTATITLYPAVNMIEGAFAFNDDLLPAAQLVDSWETSVNGLTWTFKLRSGLKFHNGEPVTAADVVGSYNRTATKSGFGKVFATEFLDSVEATDDLTFVFKLKEPTGLVIDALTIMNQGRAPWVTAKEIWSQEITDQKDYVVGTGPFKLSRWDPGDRIIMERWEDYQSPAGPTSWLTGKHTVFVDTTELIEIPDSAARVAALETGQVDWVDEYPAIYSARIQDSPNAVFLTASMGRYVVMTPNLVRPPFDSLTARRAVQVALDADKLMKAFAGGDKGVFWDTCPSFMGCSFNKGPLTSTAGAEYYNQKDMARGRELVQEAGVEGAHVRLMSPEDLVGFGDYTVPFAELLTDLGFDVEYLAMDWATVVTRRPDPDLWEVFPTGGKLGLGGAFTPLIRTYMQKDGWFNNFQDPGDRMATLMAAFAREADYVKQKELMDQIQQLAYEEIPMWDIGQQTWPTGTSKRMKNFNNKAAPYFADVWIEE